MDKASNQIRFTDHKTKKVGSAPVFGNDAKSEPAKSGLDTVGVPAAIALKGKKKKNFSLKGVSNY